MTETMVQSELEGVLVKDLVGTAVPQENRLLQMAEDERFEGRVVKVWAKVQTREGNTVTVRFVRDARKAFRFVNDLRELNFRAGFDWTFKGERMSSPGQRRLLYAVAKEAGYVDPDQATAPA